MIYLKNRKSFARTTYTDTTVRVEIVHRIEFDDSMVELVVMVVAVMQLVLQALGLLLQVLGLD